MTIDDIKDFIGERPGYLKKSAQVLAERLDVPIEDCETALYEARALARGEFNDTPMTALSVNSSSTLTRSREMSSSISLGNQGSRSTTSRT